VVAVDEAQPDAPLAPRAATEPRAQALARHEADVELAHQREVCVSRAMWVLVMSTAAARKVAALVASMLSSTAKRRAGRPRRARTSMR
jgi:hypothetical protein